VLYHDPELMLKVYRMVQAGWSYRQAALSLNITKDKVSRIMQTFKKGKAKVENGKVVQTIPPASRILQEGFEEGYRSCLDDMLKAANNVLAIAKEKWPSIIDEEETKRMLSFVMDVHRALEARLST